MIELTGYQILDRIYSGTRTLVYRGTRICDETPVVIKVLRNEYPSFSELVQFRNQYTIAKNLNLPGIIQTYSLEAYQNGYALIVEDFGGISLKEWTGEGETVPSLVEFLLIAIDLCNTLDILCRDRIIHKDIKPANILINPETKQVKLIDFSIASLLPRETQILINPNVLEGTLSYLSPEQTGRMNRGIDYRTDFYSLGVTFYELLTGKLPFPSSDPMELIHCHIAKQPPSIREINPEVPHVLASIVSKLMAKNAEVRYQSALGLKADLENCLHQLNETGKIESFAIGKRDLCDRFIIPEKLYGRATEVASLLAAFDRVANPWNSRTQGLTPRSQALPGNEYQEALPPLSMPPLPPLNREAESLGMRSQAEPGNEGNSRSEMMLVAGKSGIGKTVVINEVHKPIVRQRGYFIKGKYDQFQRNIPFSAFVQAFRDLMGQLLSESDAQLQAWKSKIIEVVGDNGQVLIDVIPELEQIIGTQSPATELSGSAAQNRFNLLMQKFVQIFTRVEHPLVMFLDDLQWADSASLNLLQLLMVETGHLLILGAYRDNEVSPTHPFILAVDAIVKTGAVVNTITLQPLSLVDMNQLVADTLNCEFSLAQPLTELVCQKTKGNPFFTTQLLKALHDDGQITFDSETRCWQCDITQIKALVITDDVVEFMALQLEKLPLLTQNTIKLAACIGTQFDLQTLAIVAEKSLEATATDLWKALQEGLVIPNTEVYKFFIQSDSTSLSDAAANPTYRFLHDRIQQAAYSLIPEDRKQATHLKIGQLLQQKFSDLEIEKKLFDIIWHFNFSQALITEQTERNQLAQLNLIAGKKAQESTAYTAAVEYSTIGLKLLALDSWQSQYHLTLGLHHLAVEVAYLNGDFELMQQLAKNVVQHGKTLLDKVQVYEIQITASCIVQSQQLEAIKIARSILQQLEVNFPDKPEPSDIQQGLDEVIANLNGKPIADLVHLPIMTVSENIAAMKILMRVIPAAFQSAPGIVPLITFEMVKLSVKYGNTAVSAYGYSLYGLLLCGAFGDIDSGYEFGKLALSLLSQFNSQQLKAKILTVINAHVVHWKKHIRETLSPALDGYSIGLATGDLEYAGYCAYIYSVHSFWLGEKLDVLEKDITLYSESLIQINQQVALNWNRIYWQTILNLQGKSEQLCCLIGTAYNEQQMLPIHQQANDCYTINHLFINKLLLCYLFGQYDLALKNAKIAEQSLGGVTGLVVVPLFYFYDSLVRLAIYSTVQASEQESIIDKIQSNQKKIEVWASHAPTNYLHKWYLVEAEQHRVLGNKADAIEMYDRAIQLAKENQFLNEEALANELAAKFYLDWGKEKVAQSYMIEAYYAYSRWGAKAKVQDLETRYPQLLVLILQQPRTTDSFKETFLRGTLFATKTSSSVSEVLDLATLLQSSQAISGEIELDRLLTTLLEIVITNAGASKCVLLLKQDVELKVVALVTEGKLPQLLPSIPLELSADVAISMVNTVKRNLEPLVLADAGRNSQFASDSYIQKHQPKSVLCNPIINQGQLIGVLYLENNLTVGAFTSDRVELLNFLCAQAAISLQNAQLYQNSQDYAQQLTQSLAKLQATETRFQNLANNIPGMVYQFRLGADGSISTPYVSSGCLDLYEVEPELVMSGKYSLYALHHPDDNPAIEKAIAESAQNLTPFEQEWRIILSSGTVKWIQSAARPERQADGAILWDGVVIDISDRKQIEAEQTRLLAIIETTSDLIGTADQTGKNLYLNRAWRDLLGLENQATAKGTEIPKYHPDWATEIIINQGLPETIRSGIWVGETAVLDRDGREIPVSQVILAHKSSDGELEYFSTILRDISDLKQAEFAIVQKSQELEQTLQVLQQAQLQMIQNEKMSALGNLVAGVAHEMNNPLGFIAASLQQAQPSLVDLIDHLKLYQESFPDPSDKILDHAEEIDLDYNLEDLPKVIDSMEMACDRLKNISTSLRTFSRADKDYKVRFNIHEGIESTILILKHRLKANEHRPDIQVITEYRKIPHIECFPGQLNQVFMNILANAIDALDESNFGLSFAEINAKPNRIVIKTSVENQGVKITITDNGYGMSEEVKQKIFDHLFTTKAVGKGTGLGLAIAHQIVVEKHQGTIEVNSALGQGTEFAIALPCHSL